MKKSNPSSLYGARCTVCESSLQQVLLDDWIVYGLVCVQPSCSEYYPAVAEDDRPLAGGMSQDRDTAAAVGSTSVFSARSLLSLIVDKWPAVLCGVVLFGSAVALGIAGGSLLHDLVAGLVTL